MSQKRSTHLVTTVHPTGYQNGEHLITVVLDTDGSRFCIADCFGCSRNYSADSDHKAVQLFLAEHACRVARFVLPNGKTLACAVNA